MKHTVEVMIPEAEIKARIAERVVRLPNVIKDSGSEEVVLVGLVRGSFMFIADLCREVQVHKVDFMTASSYGSGMSPPAT